MKKKKFLSAPLVLFVIPLFIFAYPRLLAFAFDKGSPWISFFYMYGFGLITFLIGIRLIRWSGACVPERGNEGFWYNILLFGYVFFFSLHGIWILFAIYMPFKGGM